VVNQCRMKITLILIWILASSTAAPIRGPSPLVSGSSEVTFSEKGVWERLVEYATMAPLLPSSENSRRFLRHATGFLANMSWTVDQQSWQHDTPTVNLTNLIAVKKGANASGQSPIIILGAHYDARLHADKDPNLLKRNSPVPGINDGGSGVAVILELARVLDVPKNHEVWLVLFDAEDQGNISGWSGGLEGWCIGSTFFVDHLNGSIRERVLFSIIIDLVGSPYLRLTKEGHSDEQVTSQIWETADDLGFNDTFKDLVEGAVIDDHLPFLNAGIPAVDVIQLRDNEGYAFFKWHHTTNDAVAHVSSQSLYRVGRTLEVFLESLAEKQHPHNTEPERFAILLEALLLGSIAVAALALRALARRRRRLPIPCVRSIEALLTLPENPDRSCYAQMIKRALWRYLLKHGEVLVARVCRGS